MKVCMTCDDGEVSDRSRTGVCVACQSSLSYWKKKSPARVLKRRARLAVFTTRLDTWFNTDGTRGREKANGKGKSRARHSTTH